MSKRGDTDWIAPHERLPERGQLVDWLTSTGNQVTGGRYDGLWFLPGGVYAYYTPTFWRPHNPKGRPWVRANGGAS